GSDSLRIDIRGEDHVDPSQLHAIGLFRNVDPALLASVAQSFTTERYRVGEVVVTEGDGPEKFYIVATRKVQAPTTGRHGETLRLRVPTEGACLGEMALLAETTRSATVRALTPVVLLSLGGAQFRSLLDAAPQLKDALLAMIEARRQETVRVNEYGEA